MQRRGCWDTVTKWATFKASIVKAAAQSCGQEVTANCRGSSLRTTSCKPVVKEAVKLKEEPWLLVSDPVCDIPQLILKAQPGWGEYWGWERQKSVFFLQMSWFFWLHRLYQWTLCLLCPINIMSICICTDRTECVIKQTAFWKCMINSRCDTDGWDNTYIYYLQQSQKQRRQQLLPMDGYWAWKWKYLAHF